MEIKNVVNRRATWARLFLSGALSAVLLWAQQASAQLSEPVRILPLGDSLTSSIEGSASYRYWLWKRLEARGFQMDFVGTLWGVGDGVSGIYPDFDQDHEGHFGATTDDILAGVGDWASQTQPDVVLLLIGGNDFQQGFPPAHALDNISGIIDTLRAVNPQVAILWAMLPRAADQRPQDQVFNKTVMRLARKWTRPESPIRVVNLWSGFNPAKDTVDGQHPNASGEQKFAKRFYSALTPILRRFK